MKSGWTALAGMGLSLLITCAGYAEWHVQRARVLRGVPRQHTYGHQRQSFVDSGVAVLSTPVIPSDATQWLEQRETLAMQQHRARYGCASLEDLIPRPASQLVRPVLRKSFHFRRSTLTAAHLTMDRVGLMVYDTGHIMASARITNNGGPGNEFRGNNVIVRVRAFTAPVIQQENEVTLPINSALLWESEYEQYISAGRPQVVSLVSSKQCRSALLRRHYGELTHLEVEFEYRPDR